MCNQRGIIGLRLDRDIYHSMTARSEKKENLTSLISDLEFRRSRIQIFCGDTQKIESAISTLRDLKDEAEKRVRKIKRELPEAGGRDDSDKRS